MAASAALRAGSGLVSVVTRSANRAGFLARQPEVMLAGTEDPEEKLHVKGKTRIEGDLRVSGAITSDSSQQQDDRLVIGKPDGANLTLSPEGILAENNGHATLNLNPQGGDIKMGVNQVMPAVAYGRISGELRVLSRTPNLKVVRSEGEGEVVLEFDPPLRQGDIVIVSAAGVEAFDGNLRGSSVTGIVRDFRNERPTEIVVYSTTEDHLGTGWSNANIPFNFVVYRPPLINSEIFD